MTKKTDYILWLPSWYPNKLAPYNGDFIQRHAKAVAGNLPVKVIYVVRDKGGIITSGVQKEIFTNGNLHQTIIYYFIKSYKVKAWEVLVSFKKYFSLFRSEVKETIKHNENPALVHVHIAMKAGLIALWIKRRYKIPYILTEHWTAYLEEAIPNFKNFNPYFKYLNRLVVNQAAGLSVVSTYLGQAIERIFSKKFIVIPNVVDETIFNLSDKYPVNHIHFVHISVLGYQKNVERILDAFSLVRKEDIAFTLHIVSSCGHNLTSHIDESGLTELVKFHPEMPQADLAKLIKKASALVLFSRYETFGCVLIEANACGTPVIVSNIPVFSENILEGFNGLYAETDNAKSLAATILKFIEKREEFDSKKISEHTLQKFSYTRIAGLYINWYSNYIRP